MRVASDPSRARRRVPTWERLEPWRDWAVITVVTHALLTTIVLLHPGPGGLVLAAVPLSVALATGTLTVLHDAGHRMFSRRTWPNVLATHLAVPVGLWVGHWTLKHRVHHKMSQVYPVDEATRSSGMLRLHPDAPRRPMHRQQHQYAWLLYGLAWLGELRSQLTYVKTGVVTGTETPGLRARLGSFLVEKALWLLVLTPYAVVLGLPDLALLLLAAMTFASVIAAVVLVVGHINEGLEVGSVAPAGPQWAPHLVRSTASFSTDSVVMRWLTGGMTHHLAHHLRPVAVRSKLPTLHRTTVQDVVAATGLPLVEYPSLPSAVAGHWRRLRSLGRSEAAATVAVPQVPSQPRRSADQELRLSSR